ncbi:hypothetical protein HMPREF1013_01819 [Bacillus sp. 2_A_57_CT2]|nr:hypothetical protein HMPREF1013_01819 [Bacillus sp. 2_A_57_CT2]
MDADKAYQNWLKHKDSIIALAQETINESDTRLRIIDTILIDILGWPKGSINTELSIGTKEEETHKSLYLDYVMQSDINYYLIEAKKTGRYFSVPNGYKKVFKSERGILTSHLNNKEFMNQGINYMNKLGTPFCVLSNGLQFIVIRRKRALDANDVIVFRDADDIESRFIDFYDILGPGTNGLEKIDQILSTPDEIRNKPAFNKKIYDNLYNNNDQVKHSDASIVTQNYISTFFGDLNNNSELLKDCYCDPTGRFTTFANGLKNQLLSRPLESIKRLTVKDKFGDFGNFEDKYKYELDQQNGAVFVLVGGVGAGKSTFVEHFYNFELDETNRKDLIWINFNFLDFTKAPDKVDEFITEEIIKVLKSDKYKNLELEKWETLEKMYSGEIEQLKQSLPPHLRSKEDVVSEKAWAFIEEQKKEHYESYLEKQFAFIKETLNKKICFVFDNTDQKHFEEQNSVLMNAFKRAKRYGIIIITSLRLENYFLIKDRPPFDAYHFFTFRIEPPKLKELLYKRLQASKNYSTGMFNIDYNGKVIKVPVEKFVNLLSNTFETSNSDNQVEELFESVSGGNMRRGLILFKKYIQSGHNRLYEKINLIKNIDNAKVEFNEAFDSLVRGDNVYYSSLDTAIENLFLIEDDGFYSHFTKIYLLKFLYERYSSKINDGYVLLDDLYEKFTPCFSNYEKMIEILKMMLKNFLIESDYGERDKWFTTKSVKISFLGQYYIESILVNWNYYKYILIDTPITNPSVYKILNSNFQKIEKIYNHNAKTKKIVENIEIFLEYLHACEQEDYALLDTRGGVPIKPIMEEIIKDVRVSVLEEQKDNPKVLVD